MAALRAALGISPDVYKDVRQLRGKVLEKAKAAIDQLAHFRVEWREIRQGRRVTEIECRFEPKDAPAKIATVDEIERHSTGRKARREGAVEAVADTVEVGSVVKAAISALIAPEKSSESVFPQGTIRFNAEGLAAIARTHGGGWDIDLIADAYRQQMEIGRAHV